MGRAAPSSFGAAAAFAFCSMGRAAPSSFGAAAAFAFCPANLVAAIALTSLRACPVSGGFSSSSPTAWEHSLLGAARLAGTGSASGVGSPILAVGSVRAPAREEPWSG